MDCYTETLTTCPDCGGKFLYSKKRLYWVIGPFFYDSTVTVFECPLCGARRGEPMKSSGIREGVKYDGYWTKERDEPSREVS